MKINLAGKIALVTGGTGNLGRVVVKTFADAGAKVASTFPPGGERRGMTPNLRKRVLLVEADVTDSRQVVALFSEVWSRLGSVSILINIVGGYLPAKRIEEVSTEDWDRMMTLNLKSTFLCSREFLSRLPKRRSYGRIICMSAMPALVPAANRGPYAVSKSGVSVLTKVIGEETKESGVTCNAIAPSIIRTRANMEAMPKADFMKWVSPNEIASTMLYLCSKRARLINGLTIPMFGGI